jgi:sugar lactone lactonase YvrE
MISCELEFDAKAKLGEGPCWDARHQLLYWVDIERFELHVYNPATKTDRAINVGQHIGSAVVRKSGGLLLALREGFFHLDPATEQLTHLLDPEPECPENRFNDGKCDPAGRFWAGTMHLPETEMNCGHLYCLDTDLSVRRRVDDVSISNGLAWSADERTMYFVDSPTRQCVAFDYDKASGGIRNRRVVIEIPEGAGWPDGMTIDAEGMLWIALWDGWCVRRYNPNNGALLDEIKVPVARPTSAVFGGENLDILYITSASTRLSAEDLVEQPLAGGIFKARPGVRGMATIEFAG